MKKKENGQMEKMDILQHIVNNHNQLAQIMVNGDNAIFMGEVLKELRFLAQSLQTDIQTEEKKKAENEEQLGAEKLDKKYDKAK